MKPSPISEHDHVSGPSDAALTLVEYGDFECPNCAQAYPAVKMLLGRFEHRMRFVFRHFPLLGVHPHAQLAAEAAEAAGAQHKFWPMYDLLSQHPSHLKAKDLRDYAGRIELDLERYDYEMGDQVYRQRVNEHVEGGERSGVRSTPTFFLDGAVVDVSFGLAHLAEAVAEATRSAAR